MSPSELLDCIAPTLEFSESGYLSGDLYYPAADLYRKAEEDGIKPYRLRLRDIQFSDMVWKCEGVRLADYVYHMRRAMNADPDIPIIVGPLGSIMDGYHRIMKALVDGRGYVMALRLTELPEPKPNPEKDVVDVEC